VANPDAEPWAPDPSNAPGTPPSSPYGGTGGERGTSSFAGNSNFNADGTRSGGFMGPLGGKTYHSEGVAVATVPSGGNHLSENHRQGKTATVAVASSNDTPVHATSVTLTATVTASGEEKPSGTVTFKDGSTTLGTGTLSGPGDTATYTVTGGFTAGAHSITAVFAGDSNYATATSPAHTVTAS
jgi:hypothetical protein